MKTKFKVIYNYSQYNCEIDTHGKKFEDFKAINPNTKVIIEKNNNHKIVSIQFLKRVI